MRPFLLIVYNWLPLVAVMIMLNASQRKHYLATCCFPRLAPTLVGRARSAKLYALSTLHVSILGFSV